MSGEDYLLSLLCKKPQSDYAETTFINQKACPFVKYFKDRLSVKYVGKGLLYSDVTSIQSTKPANRDTLIYYYEVKINEIGNRGYLIIGICLNVYRDIAIGLADADFPLNKHPGFTKNSFGYKSDGKIYSGKQPSELTMPKFQIGSIIGCGINYLKREVFFTFNGNYYGPAFKDVDLQEYYATLSLHSLNENVTFNFGAKPFKFDIEELILEEKREGVKSILHQPINHYSLHQIVHSYLNFHGYASTLEAFEKSAQMERQDIGLPRPHVFEEKEEAKKEIIVEEELELSPKKKIENGDKEIKDMDIELKKERAYSKTLDERFRSDSFRLEFESPIYHVNLKDPSLDLEAFQLNENSNSNFHLLKKASLLVDLNGNSNSLSTNNENHITAEKPAKHNTYLLYERAHIRQALVEGKIEEGITLIEKIFPNMLNENKALRKTLAVQKFIELIREKDVFKAIEFSQQNLTQFQNENIFSLNDRGNVQEVPIDTVMALLCYPDPENSELAHLLSFDHRDMTADVANKEILKTLGFVDKSILDILISHLAGVEDIYRDNNSQYGEVFEFKV